MDVQDLKAILDGGNQLPFPDGILINGRGSNGYSLTVEQGIYPMVKSSAVNGLSQVGSCQNLQGPLKGRP